MRWRQGVQNAKAVLSDLAGVSFPLSRALRQPCVLDPAAIALVPSRGGKGTQPVRSNGRRGIEGRPQRLGDKLQPIEGANGRQHMRGVSPLSPPGLEDPELSGDLEHPLQQALLRATRQKTISKLAEDTKVKARVGQLEAEQVRPIDPGPDRLSRLSIAQALAERHQRDQGQPPRWTGRLTLLGIEVGEVAILEDRPKRVAQGEIGAAFGKGGASGAGRLFGHGRERLLRVERHGEASRDHRTNAALDPPSHPFANGILSLCWTGGVRAFSFPASPPTSEADPRAPPPFGPPNGSHRYSARRLDRDPGAGACR